MAHFLFYIASAACFYLLYSICTGKGLKINKICPLGSIQFYVFMRFSFLALA